MLLDCTCYNKFIQDTEAVFELMQNIVKSSAFLNTTCLKQFK